jgi:hypothetical protein
MGHVELVDYHCVAAGSAGGAASAVQTSWSIRGACNRCGSLARVLAMLDDFGSDQTNVGYGTFTVEAL